ncbi:hypothetical protein E2C01_001947 [Portunus trituberculatus]|uniref:Uncharacterized protein n=1 Tax=Portunus trituberculatus TaxID=210409 RepID=A0A5B7CIK4_PORTR|nr:hypothetical protein [Portunus trituberculatus]
MRSPRSDSLPLPNPHHPLHTGSHVVLPDQSVPCQAPWSHDLTIVLNDNAPVTSLQPDIGYHQGRQPLTHAWPLASHSGGANCC